MKQKTPFVTLRDNKYLPCWKETTSCICMPPYACNLIRKETTRTKQHFSCNNNGTNTRHEWNKRHLSLRCVTINIYHVGRKQLLVYVCLHMHAILFEKKQQEQNNTSHATITVRIHGMNETKDTFRYVAWHKYLPCWKKTTSCICLQNMSLHWNG